MRKRVVSKKEKILQFCSDCSSAGAPRAFWKPLLQLGAAMGIAEILQACGLSSAWDVRGLMATFLLTFPLGSFFLPPSHQGDRKEPGIPLQQSPQCGWDGLPTRGWMSLIYFSRPNIPQRKFVGMAEGFAVHAGKVFSTALHFLLLFSVLWVAIKSFWSDIILFFLPSYKERNKMFSLAQNIPVPQLCFHMCWRLGICEPSLCRCKRNLLTFWHFCQSFK